MFRRYLFLIFSLSIFFLIGCAPMQVPEERLDVPAEKKSQEEKERLGKEVTRLEGERKGLKMKTDQLSSDIERLNSDLASTRRENSDLKARIEGLSSELERAKGVPMPGPLLAEDKANSLIKEADRLYRRAKEYSFDKVLLFDTLEILDRARGLMDKKDFVEAALKANEVILSLKEAVTKRDKKEEEEAKEAILNIGKKMEELRLSGITDKNLKAPEGKFIEARAAFRDKEYLKAKKTVEEISIVLSDIRDVHDRIMQTKKEITSLKKLDLPEPSLTPINEKVRKAEIEFGEERYQEAKESIEIASRKISKVKDTKDKLDRFSKVIQGLIGKGVSETELKGPLTRLNEARDAEMKGDYEVVNMKIEDATTLLKDIRMGLPIGIFEMAMIPSGEFVMGSPPQEKGSEDEQPQHTVFLDTYFIDIYEATNEKYKIFLEANPDWQNGGSKARGLADGDYLKDWSSDNYPPGKGDHPVVWVSWYATDAYCKWEGKRLPTEAEWEKAASWNEGGRKRLKYPWGDSEPDCRYANFARCGDVTKKVGSHEEGRSPSGIYDMAGNVREWVNDRYNDKYYQGSPSGNPKGPDSDGDRVTRGGSLDDISDKIRSAYRGVLNPTNTLGYLGFRCARD